MCITATAHTAIKHANEVSKQQKLSVHLSCVWTNQEKNRLNKKSFQINVTISQTCRDMSLDTMEKYRVSLEVEKEKKRWSVDLGLNKSLVTKEITQLHSLFPGCVRVCSYIWYLTDDHGHHEHQTPC